MKFTAAITTLAVVTTAFAQTCVQDDKLEVVNYPGGNATAFCAEWKSACQNYKPANTSLVFTGTNCRAGNITLQNRDTQASVTCSFSADGGCHKAAFFVEVAEETGATLYGPWTSD
ncbi:hypothetical protein OE88DRAFT_268047 [Heliocybe sulcata]|uniref:Small secreted protein n=1 Tax=Heliocybe sulcata TaxID=5364 RepID=A0A5C3N9P3_9AGAM|nr:hypothetical protein OE88DRAFT_268047 [Heliocybe sulcata]